MFKFNSFSKVESFRVFYSHICKTIITGCTAENGNSVVSTPQFKEWF